MVGAEHVVGLLASLIKARKSKLKRLARRLCRDLATSANVNRGCFQCREGATGIAVGFVGDKRESIWSGHDLGSAKSTFDITHRAIEHGVEILWSKCA